MGNLKEKSIILSKILAWISALLWIISLTQDAFIFVEYGSYKGYMVLIVGTIFGWTADHIGYFAVYANYIWIVLLFAILFKSKLQKTILIGHAFLWLVAMLTFTLKEILINEAGGKAEPNYGLGLYLWFAAFFLTTLSELIRQKIIKIYDINFIKTNI